MPAPKKLLLIDSLGLIFRAYHVPMPARLTAKGLPTKVPYLFATMLRRILNQHQPDCLAAVFDVSGPTFRDHLYEQYKAQRPPMPDELAQQLPLVRRYCQAARLPIVELQGYEADDLIGALALQAAKKNLDVLILTSDKDMLQLVGPGIRVLRPGVANTPDRLVDESGVEEILGVPPEKVADLMALLGDKIDNIPGAKGIGEKGAVELIRRFGTAEAALERAAEVESKRYREALLNSRDAVLLSKKLATIASDAPYTLDLPALARRDPDFEALRSLYIELELNSLLKELPPSSDASPAQHRMVLTSASADYSQLESASALKSFLDSLPVKNEISFWLSLAPDDSEEPGFHSKIAAVEISPAPGVSRTAWLDEQGEILSVIQNWLAGSPHPKIVHDPKLAHFLIGAISSIRHATELYSYLLRPTTSKHSLADVVLRYRNTTLTGAPGESAEALQHLAPILCAEVERQNLLQVYETIDLPLAPVLAQMERHGVRVDPAALAEMSAAMEKEIRARETRIYELAGQEFNVNSPKQLAEILFDKLNLSPPQRRGARKDRSTAAEVLESLAAAHPLPREIIDYREIAKLKSTYVDALPKLIHPLTQRLHTSLSQTATATGRLASSNPNLQNIPVRTDLGRQIRAAFAAAPGWTLLSADYSQIELRLLAHFSEDPVLIEAFQRGQDIHARTAEEVFGIGPLMQTKEHRRAAKAINFGIVYGQTPFGLAQQLGVEQKDAAKFIAAYFDRYRGVKAWLDAQIAATRRDGFTRTLHGRVRPIPEITAEQPALRNFAERTAVNTPLQGTAADLIKLAMISLHRTLASRPEPDGARAGGLRSKMILQVHDELLFECPPEELEELRPLVKSAMESVASLRVPLVADLKSGPNWRDMA